MKFRDHPSVQGKQDAYPCDPRLLKVKPGYNVRDLDSPEERPALDELKSTIRDRGVDEPLKVQVEGSDAFVIRGHRRHRAVMELIAEGLPIETVLVLQVPRGMNDADLNLDIINGNDQRKDLTQLQIAEVIRRQYVVYKWDIDRIAKGISKTRATVVNALKMSELPEDVKAQINAKDVSATTAVQVVKEVREAKQDPAFAAELIRKNKEENAKIKGKGKSHRVTAKTLKRGKPKPEPKVKPDAEITNAGTDSVHHQAPAMVATDSEPLLPVSQERVHETNGDAERDSDIVRVGSQQPRHVPFAVRELLIALKPFADLCNDFDANAKADDDIVEVLFADIKKAWSVYTAATGGQEEVAA